MISLTLWYPKQQSSAEIVLLVTYSQYGAIRSNCEQSPYLQIDNNKATSFRNAGQAGSSGSRQAFSLHQERSPWAHPCSLARWADHFPGQHLLVSPLIPSRSTCAASHTLVGGGELTLASAVHSQGAHLHQKLHSNLCCTGRKPCAAHALTPNCWKLHRGANPLSVSDSNQSQSRSLTFRLHRQSLQEQCQHCGFWSGRP